MIPKLEEMLHSGGEYCKG